MTLPFTEKRPRPAPPALLVLVLPSESDARRPLSLADGGTAGVLARCRKVLAHARAADVATAFVTARPRNSRRALRWIKGLEPRGRDMVFDRINPSCYASRYFSDAVDGYPTLVIAGFLDMAACVATVIDAVRDHHDMVFLHDAIAGPGHVSLASLRRLTSSRICLRGTAAWIAETSAAPFASSALVGARTGVAFPPSSLGGATLS
jgi:hypothetical protein